MKKNAITCPQKDYDFYTIPFPFKALFRSQKDRYIFSQLEKLHPCFSDDCSFDTHLRIEKSGLKADVVVMQKYKLAQYKAGKTNIIFNESPHHLFFAGKNKRPAFIFIIALILLIIILSRWQSATSENQPAQITTESEPVEQNKELIIVEFLNAISDSKACITDFSWTFDGYNESSSMLIKGLYPEQLMEISAVVTLSPVTFQASVPVMTVSLNRRHALQKEFDQALYNKSRGELRSFINRNNLILMEETVQPYGIKLEGVKNQCDEISALLNFLEQNDFPLSSLKIKTSQNQIRIEIIFSSVNFADFYTFYESLKNNIKIFFAEENPKKENIQPEASTPAQALVPQQKLSKIGQIIKPDGSIISYYKDEKGKIIKR